MINGLSSASAVLAATLLVFGQAAGGEEQARSADASPIQLEIGDGVFTLVATEVELSEIIDALAEAAEFEVSGQVDTSEDRVSAELTRVFWRDGLGRLLSEWSFTLVMKPGASTPEKLLIGSRKMAVRPASAPASGKSDVARGDPAAPALADKEDDPPEEAPVEPEPDAPTAETSLEEATRIANELAEAQEDPVSAAIERAKAAAAAAADAPEDPMSAERYAEALGALQDVQDSRVLDVASQALQSPSYQARAAALRAIRYNSETSSDPMLLGELSGVVTSDPNPQVRREALEVLVRYGDSAEVLSLVQTLGRTESPVRDIAVREWLRIEKEMQEQARMDPSQPASNEPLDE
jgi:hypothetical protein